MTVTVTDDDGAVTSDSLTVLVSNAAPVVQAGNNQTVDEGETVDIVTSFTDAGSSDTHTAIINWGDGSPAVAIDPIAGSITGSHAYADDGDYTVTVTVTDDDGAVTSDHAGRIGQ